MYMSAEKRAEKVCGRKMKMKHASTKIKKIVLQEMIWYKIYIPNEEM